MKPIVICMLLVSVLSVRATAQCDYILVSTTDFSTGSTSSLDTNDKTPTNNVEAIHSDAIVRRFYDLVCVVNRAGADNLQFLDPCNGFNTVHQFSTGNGSNPHDVVFLSPTVAYVSRYDLTTVLKMNPQTGATLGTINLSVFADADGLPEMDQMFVAGGYVCVNLQRLDRNNFYSPVGSSYIAVIDPATDTLVDMNPVASGIQPVVLPRTNPYSEVNLGVFQGTPVAYFSAVGFFGLSDGGLVKVDLSNPASTQVLLTENAAGGDILDAEIISDTKGFAIIATPSFTTELIAFNPSTGLKLGSTLYAPGGYDLSDIEPSPLGLLVADRKAVNPGIRCFDMATNAQIPGGPINVGLPPFDILVHMGDPVAVGDTPLLAALGANYPNPFNPSTSIPYTLSRDGRTLIRVFDVNGRLVRTLLDAAQSSGSHTVKWDGMDDHGRAVASGAYLVRLETTGLRASRKIMLLK